MDTTRYRHRVTEPNQPVIIIAPSKPEPSKNAKILGGVITLIIAVGCLIGGIALFSGGSKNTPSSSPAVVATTAAAENALPDRMICRMDAGGGSFYLLIVSATAHDFSACAGSTPYNGTIDQLLNGTNGIDRRCFLGNSFIAQWHASGGVYSDKKKADLAAERDYCSANGGTN